MWTALWTLLWSATSASNALNWLLNLTLQGTLLLCLATAAVWLLPCASAALRHLVWLLGLGGLLTLPLLNAVMPSHLVLLSTRPTPHSLPRAPERPVATSEVTTSTLPALRQQAPVTPDAMIAPGHVDWPLLVLGVWLCGMLVVGARIINGLRGIRQLEQESEVLAQGPLTEQSYQIEQMLRLGRPVTLRRAKVESRVMVPLTWGWRRPVVLLPPDAEAWVPLRQRAILLHELAHVRRGDWMTQLVAAAACAVFWFHPLAWRAARSLRMESEQATDDRVLAAGIRASDYGEYLLEFVRLLGATQRRPNMKLALGITQGSTLKHRLCALLDSGRNRRDVSRLNVLFAVGLVASVLATLTTVRAVGNAASGANAAEQVQLAQPAGRPTLLPIYIRIKTPQSITYKALPESEWEQRYTHITATSTPVYWKLKSDESGEVYSKIPVPAAQAHNLKSTRYGAQSNLPAALEEARQAVLADPANRSYQWDLAIMLQRSGHREEAMKVLRQVAAEEQDWLGKSAAKILKKIEQNPKWGLPNQATEAQKRFSKLIGDATEAATQGDPQKAKEYAQELLRQAPSFKTYWNYGNALHYGHLALGHVALREGDLQTASKELIEAGQTPGSPQLNSFGPNMALAKALLEKGEKNSVLQYFEECKRFWKSGSEELERWKSDILDNRSPDFGANLVY